MHIKDGFLKIKISPASLTQQLVLELYSTVPQNLMNLFSGNKSKQKTTIHESKLKERLI